MSELIHASSFFQKVNERDILSELLADKRSFNTRKAYERDLKDFFQSVANVVPSPALIREFLELERGEALSLVLGYKAKLIERGLAEATVNRRICSIKSLVKYAQKISKCSWSLEEIQGEKVKAYRDTSGISKDAFKLILEAPNRETLKGARDYAILRLLWENALRRGEVVKTNVENFDPEARTLSILGKGRGSQVEKISLSIVTVEAIQEWLNLRGNSSPTDALFTAINNVHFGHRLTGESIYDLVKIASQSAGVKKQMSPHRVRHSAITEALNITGGDVRKVQRLSRHAKADTVLIYNDARQNVQGEITDLLSLGML